MNYHEARSYIKQQGILLQVGQSKRMLCPICAASHEKSLMVTNRGDSVAYICPRAKCSLGGSVISLHGMDRKETLRAPRKDAEDITELEILPVTISYWLQEKYELSLTQVSSWKYAPRINALMLPIKDRFGKIVGSNYRRLPGDFLLPEATAQASKSNIKMFTSAHRLHYTYALPTKAKGALAVVEDQISAEKLSPILPTVALLGTHMSYEVAFELSTVKDSLILALDADAYRKMGKIAKEYSGMFKKVSFIFLDKDPKDTKWAELQRLFNTYIGI